MVQYRPKVALVASDFQVLHVMWFGFGGDEAAWTNHPLLAQSYLQGTASALLSCTGASLRAVHALFTPLKI